VWGHFDGDQLSGIIAFRDGWIEQLYVLPAAQGRGIGTELINVAKGACARLELWTFQRNARARRFYQARGFMLAEETDGARNEEKEPDARYVWMRTSG
jgi:GNAT superfamily N-acetyltransferase